MSEDSPSLSAAKWRVPLSELRDECQSLWERGRPRKPWLKPRDPEADGDRDEGTPKGDRMILGYHGYVVLGHFARAFFPAYIPGTRTHYGSVVYSLDPAGCDDLFELAWRVNQLRKSGAPPPPGTEQVAWAIGDDQSQFSRLDLPAQLGGNGKGCFGNLCIHRSRLPLGYLHSRLVPILIEPRRTKWCCLLPLRFWSSHLIGIWQSGPPCYPQEVFSARCRALGINP
jgi:hypothetical protein